MIRPLRRQHRITILILALVLAVLFIVGLMARKPVPVNSRLPSALLQTSAGGQR
ncbi:MAG: hypothetical protein JST85_30030 [Acidobacteria bacterium]|nr:hypothetical protein [Acidobacteriota bacterium]